MAKNILILAAHPHIETSGACGTLLGAVKDIENVDVIDLYKTPFTTENYLEPVKKADTLVLLFPFWWGAAPSKMKEWIDTFMLGFVDNPGMKDKELLVVVTTGAPEEEYHAGGSEQFTVDELLRPYQFMGIYSQMKYLKPFVVYGTMLPGADERIDRAALELKARIENL